VSANSAKDTDTKDMKRLVLTLIPSEYLPEGGISVLYALSPDPETNKAWRGFKNCTTGRLLCPVKYLQRFKDNPEE
jgi:hypothetical protein